MKLDLAKLVELRKRSRIERARQLSSNIEAQAHILRQTEPFNLQAEYLRMKALLGGMGENVPVVAKARKDALENRGAELESKNAVSVAPVYVTRQRTLDGELVNIPVTRRAPAAVPERKRTESTYTGAGLVPWIRNFRKRLQQITCLSIKR